MSSQELNNSVAENEIGGALQERIRRVGIIVDNRLVDVVNRRMADSYAEYYKAAGAKVLKKYIKKNEKGEFISPVMVAITKGTPISLPDKTMLQVIYDRRAAASRASMKPKEKVVKEKVTKVTPFMFAIFGSD